MEPAGHRRLVIGGSVGLRPAPRNEEVEPPGTGAEESERASRLSPFPPRPSNAATSSVAGSAAKKSASKQALPTARPIGDLWLSVMCALGEGEADLAHMMLDGEHVRHELGDAVDNFR